MVTKNVEPGALAVARGRQENREGWATRYNEVQGARKKAAAKKKQKAQELKEIKLRPNIDTHDYEVKAKKIAEFFEDGDKVKITLRFRGREMAHQHLGMELLQRVKADFAEIMKVELEPKLEGRQMTMVMSPIK